ncbi:MAG: M20/M25/M40 family metallo-hydrolase [Proteobacteria bacterium]|nr:M20/M25/M40 family metallo-hydrolase [Pseudomonadota bacterium]
MVNEKRLAETFMELVRVDSPSGREAVVAADCEKRLAALGCGVVFDGAGPACGSDSGNLVATFPGDPALPALLISAHMDTVQPGEGIEPVLENGVFSSRGDTILGADDKSAIAVILEVLALLREQGSYSGPSLEIVLTICEESGLLGAKHMGPGLITAPHGYCLDARDPDGLVTRAPAANKLRFTVLGRDAHAGAEPELGINAISLAARAIARLDLGRVDHETTCNLGIIQGGVATNIVPGRVEVQGEARSHDPAKLAEVTNRMVAAFTEEVEKERKRLGRPDGLPGLEAVVEPDFPRLGVPDSHPLVQAAAKAAKNLGRSLTLKTSGGGSDANIFFNRGIAAGVLGTGMEDMHTPRETVALASMTAAADLLLEIIRVHGADGGA